MVDKKKLLEEAAVRKFMKIAGTSALSDEFVKKQTLKEENRGERTMDPHDEDPRHDNLKEDLEEEGQDLEEAHDQIPDNADHKLKKESEDLEESAGDETGEVQEESKGKLATSTGKEIQSGTGLSGAGKKPTKKMQYETKSKVKESKGKLATSTGKEIQSGTGLSGAGKKPTKKMQYEELEEEGQELNEFDDDQGGMGGEPEMPPMDSEMGPGEPDGDEGAPNIAGIVRAIAAAIEAETGVQVSVEGGEGGDGMEDSGEEMPPPDEMGGEEEPEQPPMEEYGMYDYKAEDPAAKMSPPRGQVGSHKDAQVSISRNVREGKRPVAKKDVKASLVETITKNVLAKLAGAAAKKKDAQKTQAKQITKPVPKAKK